MFRGTPPPSSRLLRALQQTLPFATIPSLIDRGAASPVMAYPYDDRTTRYDPHDSYGRHEHYGSGYDSGYGVSHSHSYGHHEYEYPSQQHRRYRNPPASAPAPAEYDYDHGHGQYDYPTGVATPSAAALYAGSDPYGASHWEGQNYQADPYTGGHSHSDPSTHGAGYVGSNPSAYGEVYNDTAGAHGAGYDSGPPNVEDVYHADETFGRDSERDRKKRPKLLGYVYFTVYLHTLTFPEEPHFASCCWQALAWRAV